MGSNGSKTSDANVRRVFFWDGKAYTQKEFLEYHGEELGKLYWDAADVRRADWNGQAYTKSEFIDFHGEDLGKRYWDEAPVEIKTMPRGKRSGVGRASSADLRRLTPDGKAYTHSEFVNFYGEDLGEYFWEHADVRRIYCWDERAYTHKELIELYGEELGQRYWDEAAVEMKKQARRIGKKKGNGSAADVRRVARDGRAYTQNEFFEFYGRDDGSYFWDEAGAYTEAQAAATVGAAASTSAGADLRRVARDGRAYTREEFVEFYGADDGSYFWEEAEAETEAQAGMAGAAGSKAAAVDIRRVARDGNAYTLGEFCEFYGTDGGLVFWEEAMDADVDSSREVAADAAASLSTADTYDGMPLSQPPADTQAPAGALQPRGAIEEVQVMPLDEIEGDQAPAVPQQPRTGIQSFWALCPDRVTTR